MIDLNTAEIAAITGGRPTATATTDQQILGVATDSRECQPGWLFVAKPGEASDGHHFIDTALAAGAVLALAERETTDASGQIHPAIIVEDAVIAMGLIAAHMVNVLKERGGMRVIGITGSAGKTTTKDLLAAILASDGETVAPVGSYNGEVGVPLTVFRATETTKYLVVEMGATGIGHIEYLGAMVKPEIGVVLCVGSAHAGEFGSPENTARAKGELVEALDASGVAILNHDDGIVAAMASRSVAPVLGFGIGYPGKDGLSATSVHVNEQGHPEFELSFPNGETHHVRAGLIGHHHVSNLLAAAAAAHALGIAPAVIAQTLTDLGPGSRWRMERTERADGVTVINDAYNANPQSMRAALRALAELGLPNAEGTARRTWAVLGEMRELGSESIFEHDLLGRVAVRLNIKKLLVVGRAAKPAYNSAVLEGSWGDEALYVENDVQAEALLRENLEPGDIVLFKSSNGAGLRFLGDRIASENSGSLAAKEESAQ